MMMRGLVLTTLLWCLFPIGVVTAEVVAEEDGAPILLMYAPASLSPPITAGLSDVVRRDGGALIDLSPKAESPVTAGLDLQHAVAAYQDFDYGRAMGHLREAIEQAEKRAGEGLSTAQLSDLFIYRALVRSKQGDTSAGWEDFVQAAIIDPTRHLDAVRFSPSVAASFERARLQVTGSTPTTVRIKVPTDCEVLLDARSLSPTSVVQLRPGRHFLRVTRPGFKPHVSLILVDGAEMELKPTLEPLSPPAQSELLAVAKARGFRHLIWAWASEQGKAPPTAIFVLLDVNGKERARTSISLSDPTSDRAAVQVAVSRLLDKLVPAVVVPPIRITSTPWYRQPWLWASAGVLVTSAVLLPFALRDNSSSGFGVSLGGTTP